MGKHIVTARRNGGSWFVGGMTDWEPRDITVDYSFLPEGATFKATMMVDGINADKQAQDYAKTTATVTRDTKTSVHLASGGGFAIRLDPMPAGHGTVTAIPAEKRAAIPDFYKK